MAEVLFYHLTESTLEDALPGLLEKTLRARLAGAGADRHRRAARRARRHLWTFRDDSFLAHGTDRDPHAEAQPVLLTTGQDNRNARRRCVSSSTAPSRRPDAYERSVFMFDGHDQAQVEAARDQWKVLKAAGNAVTYWQQTPERRWERKA